MSRPKQKKMKMRLKREANELFLSGVEKKPSRELVRLAKLYKVSLKKYHWNKQKKVNAY